MMFSSPRFLTRPGVWLDLNEKDRLRMTRFSPFPFSQTLSTLQKKKEDAKQQYKEPFVVLSGKYCNDKDMIECRSKEEKIKSMKTKRRNEEGRGSCRITANARKLLPQAEKKKTSKRYHHSKTYLKVLT